MEKRIYNVDSNGNKIHIRIKGNENNGYGGTWTDKKIADFCDSFENEANDFFSEDGRGLGDFRENMDDFGDFIDPLMEQYERDNEVNLPDWTGSDLSKMWRYMLK